MTRNWQKRYNTSNSDRNYDDPKYKEFRKKVLLRDGYSCQWPNCGSRKRLRVHHIRTWANYPSLRFEVSNGITLCKTHHDQIWSDEESYVRLFATIILQRDKNRERQKQSRKSRNTKNNKRAKTTKATKKKRPKTFREKYIEQTRKARRNR